MLAYAVGWTQHTAGRADDPRRRRSCSCCWATSAAPGGGIMAMRGHASIQGSSDIPTLYDLLPGYLPMPQAQGRADRRSTTTSRAAGAKRGWWCALRQVHRLAAEGLVRRRGDRGERLRLRPPAEADRQPLALPDHDARARRRARGAVRDGPEPGGRLPARGAAAARARARSSGWWSATCRTSRPPPSGRTRRRCARASFAPRTSRPRCS